MSLRRSRHARGRPQRALRDRGGDERASSCARRARRCSRRRAISPGADRRATGRLIAQGRDIPIHLGVMGFTVKEFLKRMPGERLRDGDVWFLNLPEVGGNHLPDVKAMRPVFVGGRLVAFAINLAHWADIGGAVPVATCRGPPSPIQEGLRIAPIRLFSAGRARRAAIRPHPVELRGREEREGDSSPSTRRTTSRPAGSASSSPATAPRPSTAASSALHAESEAQMRRGASARCPTASGKARTGSTTTASTTGPSASTYASRSRATSARVRLHGHRRRRSAAPSTRRTSSRAPPCTTP